MTPTPTAAARSGLRRIQAALGTIAITAGLCGFDWRWGLCAFGALAVLTSRFWRDPT